MNILYTIYIALLGLITGSFLTCLIWRLHTRKSLGGRSQCPDCNHIISWFDNIPVLSFLLLQARCRHCRKKISWRYPIIELITAILFTLLFSRLLVLYGSPEVWSNVAWLTLLRDVVFVSALVIVFVSDILWYIIFDEVVLPAALVVGGLNIILGTSWQNLLISATIGSGFFLIQFLISRGRWIGGGDIRLGLLLGLGLGWPFILPAIFLAYFSGAIVGLGLLFFHKRGWKSVMPLGTFLAVSGIVVLFFGSEIINWYLALIYRS